jgi:hypothetical protein
LFGCFRKGDANDPEVYVAAISAMLAQYPDWIVIKVTDPMRGIPSEMDFLPTVKEVRDACEKLMTPFRQEQERQERIKQQLADREIDKSERLTYQELCEKYGGDGRGSWGLETHEKRRAESDRSKNDQFLDPDEDERLRGLYPKKDVA